MKSFSRTVGYIDDGRFAARAHQLPEVRVMPLDFISPVTPETCRPLIGKPVCVGWRDGSRSDGQSQAADADRLLLGAKTAWDSGRPGHTARAIPLPKIAHFPTPPSRPS